MATIKNKLLGNIVLPKTQSLGNTKIKKASLGSIKKIHVSGS